MRQPLPALLEPLGDLVANLDSLADDLTLYVQGGVEWGRSSPASALPPMADGDIPLTRGEMRYLLEVAIARDVLAVWRQWRDGRAPTRAEACAAIIHYARFDAYLDVEPPSDSETGQQGQ